MNTTLLEELGVVKIAAPCSVPWSSMKGDSTSRFCEQCQLNVYNVESLNSYQVRDLILKKEGRVCMRIFKRFDGTILTKDCPRGIEALGYVWRRSNARAQVDARTVKATSGLARALVIAATIIFFSLGVIELFGDNIRRLMSGPTTGALAGDPTYDARAVKDDPRAGVLARFNASPPCPTRRAPGN